MYSCKRKYIKSACAWACARNKTAHKTAHKLHVPLVNARAWINKYEVYFNGVMYIILRCLLGMLWFVCMVWGNETIVCCSKLCTSSGEVENMPSGYHPRLHHSYKRFLYNVVTVVDQYLTIRSRYQWGIL